MSRKLVTPEKKVFDAFDMSGAGTSIETDCEQLDRIRYDVSWTGTPTGNISVQVSNTREVGSWKTITIDPSLDIAGVAGSAEIDIQNVCWKYVRLSWSFTGGVGTLNAFYKAHSQGA